MEVHVTELSTGYPQGEDWVDDDRVLCQNCANPVEVVQRLSMPSEQMEKHRKVNAVPLRWMFEEAKIRGGWATATWNETQCGKTGLAVIPAGVKHRCHLFTQRPASVESDSWWLQ